MKTYVDYGLTAGKSTRKLVSLALLLLTLSLPHATNQVTTEVPVPASRFDFIADFSTSRLTGRSFSTDTFQDQVNQAGRSMPAMQHLEDLEYRFSKLDSANAYSTPNRKNNLRFYYDEFGFTVEPRTTRIPVANSPTTEVPGEITYKTIPGWKVAFKLDKNQVGNGIWQIDENKAEYKTDNVTVQYINNEEGMRQNFIVQRPLSAGKNLDLNFSVATSLNQQFASDRLRFIDDNNTAVLNYDQLKVWDADGRQLAAAFQKRNDIEYSIRVNTERAAYPVTIDPISTTPSAILEVNQENSGMGGSASAAGDINGDGYGDLIVGAQTYDNGQLDEGATFIYHGSAAGISPTPTLMIESNQPNAQFGSCVATAGDVNGDGYSDVLVGVLQYGPGNEGAVFIYHGSANGITATPSTIVQGSQAGAEMGRSVASAGDVNGDGYSDIIVGAHEYSNGQAEEGAAFIFLGSIAGINTTPTVVVESNQPMSNLGFSVSSAGDVNADGYSDVIVGAINYDNGESNEGTAFIFHGSPTGVSSVPAVSLEYNQVDAYGGHSVASAGDVNGDGYSDVVVGVYRYDNGQADEGAAFVYHGSASGINATVAAQLEVNQDNTEFGKSVACAGDVNGDAYSDIVVGASGYENGQSNEGAAFVYQGSATGVALTATTRVEGNLNDTFMGWSVASAGDVNGDGYSDMVVGSPYYSNVETTEGGAWVYLGGGGSINTSTAAAFKTESNQASAFLAWAVAGAGDVNGDGYSDIAVGAYLYDNGENNEGAIFIFHGSATGLNTTPAIILEGNLALANLGYSLAGAGDVNGDGYSDIIAGARFFSNGQTDEGAAYIFYGSPSGITAAGATRLECDQNSAQMGYSVGGAGDVNDDGYSDVIVGIYQYSNGQTNEGAAFVYHGSPSGLITTAAVKLESNQDGANMGCAVAGAGDVNGDGYTDVIAGAYAYDNAESSEGVAFVYYGSASGVAAAGASRLESNQSSAFFGYSVSCAGDVNGDGYSDIIVGSYLYNNGQNDEGAAFIYHGSASGIVTTAAAMVESNQNNARMGSGVASAGDVNGDGYSDVIAGAGAYSNGHLNEGIAFIYHGSPAGVITTAAGSVEGNLGTANMGYSLSDAGDVNGDGYSDVIFGAYSFSNGETYEGTAFVYYGNGATNSSIPSKLNLYNTDLLTPLNSSNFTATRFGAGLFAKSFLGRGKGKMVWETTLNHDPFSGTPISNSTAHTGQQTSYSDLSLTGTELKDLITKENGRYTKLRARIKYDPVTAITGQLYGPWRYVAVQLTGSSPGVLPVDLISFNAEWQEEGKTAAIRFTTENETAICCYEIEKSSDGLNFNTITQLAAVNSSMLYTYRFADKNATGRRVYYRLKTIHQSGDVEYSNIVSLQQNNKSITLVFPNPATDILYLKNINTYGKLHVQITNSSGSLVKQFSCTAADGQTLEIPVHNLTPGIYFLLLQSEDNNKVLQFVKE